MIDETAAPPLENRRLWRGLTIVLVVGLALLRLAYLVFVCPLDLAQDEAHYWDWSRHLDWSYYSKGPLIAWIIRGGIELFGPLSIALTGNEMLAVRIPSVIFGSLLLVGIHVLSLQVFRSDRLAFFTVFCLATMPVIAAVSILMTIDSPFVCLWSWALVAGHRAVFRNDRWAWLLTGLLVGLGILAKYTMALWLFSLGLFLVFTPAFRPILYRTGFWSMVGIALLSCLPILYWNSKNDWVTFRHVAGQAGVPMANRNQGIRWLGPLEYVGGQFALLIGYWFVCWAWAMIHHRPTRETDPGVRYLWWLSAPTFLVFGLSTIKSGGQLNWPVAAYLSGSVLMSAWLLKAIHSPNRSFRRLTRLAVSSACVLGLLISIVGYETRFVRPALAEVAKRVRKDDPYSIRAVDPICRFKGWKLLGREIDALRREVVELEGVDPCIAAINWAIPGELGFYCQGHPQAYSLGPYVGDRHSQYDLWRPNPVADAQVFRGKTFVVVSDHKPTLEAAFARVSPAREVVYSEDNVPMATWTIWVCSEFRGIPITGPGRTNY